MTCQNFTIKRELWSMAVSHPWPSNEDLAYTIESAASKCFVKKLSESNKCWNTDNEAQKTRETPTLSPNFVVPTNCQLFTYYFLSLSRISSTSHIFTCHNIRGFRIILCVIISLMSSLNYYKYVILLYVSFSEKES